MHIYSLERQTQPGDEEQTKGLLNVRYLINHRKQNKIPSEYFVLANEYEQLLQRTEVLIWIGLVVFNVPYYGKTQHTMTTETWNWITACQRLHENIHKQWIDDILPRYLADENIA